MNDIEHGSVDSTISFHLTLSAKKSKDVNYWICVGKRYSEIEELNEFILSEGINKVIDATNKYWNGWVNKTNFKLTVKRIRHWTITQIKNSTCSKNLEAAFFCSSSLPKKSLKSCNWGQWQQFLKNEGALTC